MKELLRKIKKEWGRPFRQRVSWVLICTFFVQTMIPGVATPVLGGEKIPGSWIEITELGEPEGAFTSTQVRTGDNKVQDDLSVPIEFEMEFSEGWLSAHAESTAQPEISVSFEIKNKNLFQDYKGDSIDIESDNGPVGTLHLSLNDTEDAIAAEIKFFNEVVYPPPGEGGYQLVNVGGKFSMQLSGVKAGDEVELDKNRDEDLELTVNTEDQPATESDGRYSLEKKSEVGEEGTITYTLTARASASEASPGYATPTSARSYTSVKKASASESTGSEIQEKGKTYLDDKYIIDHVPSELRVDKIYLGADKDTRIELNPLNKYLQDNGDIVIPIASAMAASNSDVVQSTNAFEYNAEGKIIKAVVTIEASLKDTEVRDPAHARDINSEQGYTWQLHNEAEMKDSEDGDTLAKDTDDNRITMKCLVEKDGKEADATVQLLNWTIHLDANIRSTESYIVDWVKVQAGEADDDQISNHNDQIEYLYPLEIHIGDPDSGNIVEASPSSAELIKLEGTVSPDKFFSLKDGGSGEGRKMVSEVMGAAKKIKDLRQMEYTYTDPETKRKEIYFGFILPAQELIGKPVWIKYQTKIIPDENVTIAPTSKVDNSATFFYRYTPGGGLGPDDWVDNVSFDKSVEYNHAIVKKSLDSYDPKTQTAVWKFEINRTGVDVNELTIRDTFDPKEQQLLMTEKSFNNGELELEKRDREKPNVHISGDRNLPKANEQSKETDDYYSYNGQTGELLIHMADIKADDYYVLNLTSRIVKPDLFSQETSKGFVNRASYDFKIGETEKTGVITKANLENKTELITKKSIGQYDYVTNLMEWEVGFNNDRNYCLKDAYVRDELPEGVIFDPGENCRITSVTRTERGKTGVTLEGEYLTPAATSSDIERVNNSVTELARYEIDENHILSVQAETQESSGYTKQILYLFPQVKDEDGNGYSGAVSEDAWTICFTTCAEEKFRHDQFRSNELKQLKNVAYLKGQIVVPGKDDLEKKDLVASASSLHSAAVPVKKGVVEIGSFESDKYDGLPWISWNLLVNRTGADYAGAVLTDEIAVYMELEPESLTYYWVKVNSNGGIDESENKEFVSEEKLHDLKFKIEKDAAGFKITYPEHSDFTSKTLLIQYDTIVTGKVPNSKAENNVVINLDGEHSDAASGSANNIYSMDDSAYVRLTKLKLLNLLKLSENSNGEKGVLAGAEFKIDALYEWKKNGGGDNGTDWSKLDKPYLAKTAVTNNDGRLRFVRLRTDYLYKLTEENAAPGYDKASFDPIYFLISDNNGEPNVNQIKINPDHFVFHYSKNNATLNYTAINKLKTDLHHLQFIKLDEITKTPIPGVTFKLWDSKDLFKGGELLETNGNGVLTLPTLDPNTVYRLKEEVPGPGYQLTSGYLEIKVEMAVGDVYSFRVEPKEGMEKFYISGKNSLAKTVSTDVVGYITNRPLLANVKFPKTDQLGNLLSDPKYNDISFKMTPGRDGAKEEDILYLNEGWLKLENLRCGTYTLTENGLPDSLKGEFSEVNPPQKIEITVSPNYESADSTGSKDSANCKVTFKNCTSENPKEQFDVNAVAVTETVQGNEITYWVPESTEKQPYPLHIINNRQFGYVQIHKVEALMNDGKTEITDTPVEGAVFAVYEAKGDGSAPDADAKEVLTLTTDKEGKFPVNYTNLVCNQEYFLKEIFAPEGYQMDPDLKNGVPFTIRKDQETVYIGLNKKAGDTVTRDEKQEVNPKAGDQGLLYYNIKRGTGSLRAAKYGAYQETGGTVSRKALAGAEFGLLKASPSEISYKTVSDENGLIRFDNVTAGTYTLRELSAPSGYAKPADGEGEQVVEIHEHQTTGLTLEDQLVFNNEPLAFSLKLHKTDSDGQSLSGAKFLLQAVSADQTVTDLCYLKETENGIHVLPDPLKAEDQPLLTLKNDTIWDYFTLTGEETEGRLDPSKASAALYYGSNSSYQVKEVKAPAGYVLDEAIYPVDRERAKKLDGGAYLISNHKAPDGEAVFANFIGYGDIAGRKVSAPQMEQSSSVAGAVMGLFAEGTETFTAETTYQGMTAASGEDGSFRFEHVPYGTYLVAEITAPSGYYLNTTDSFRVTVSSGESLEGIRVTKDPATGERAMGADAEPIVIADEKRSESGGDGNGGHGDHGGHGGGYKTSGGPGADTGPGKDLKDILPVPSKPDEPLPSVQTIIEEPKTLPVPSKPGEPLPSDQEIIEEPETLPVPSEPDESLPSDQEIIEEPETQEGDYVITTLDGKEVYRGKDRPSREFRCSLPAGEYLEFMDIGGESIPLARFRVDEGGVLTELSLTGDTGRSMLLLWLLLGGGAAFALLLFRRRRRVN